MSASTCYNGSQTAVRRPATRNPGPLSLFLALPFCICPDDRYRILTNTIRYVLYITYKTRSLKSHARSWSTSMRRPGKCSLTCFHLYSLPTSRVLCTTPPSVAWAVHPGSGNTAWYDFPLSFQHGQPILTIRRVTQELNVNGELTQ